MNLDASTRARRRPHQQQVCTHSYSPMRPQRRMVCLRNHSLWLMRRRDLRPITPTKISRQQNKVACHRPITHYKLYYVAKPGYTSRHAQPQTARMYGAYIRSPHDDDAPSWQYRHRTVGHFVYEPPCPSKNHYPQSSYQLFCVWYFLP
jgi:hypothetical protein